MHLALRADLAVLGKREFGHRAIVLVSAAQIATNAPRLKP
jgi:hypothetical protein